MTQIMSETKDKEGRFIMVKGQLDDKEVTVECVCTSR